MYGYIILRDIPKKAVQLDLSIFEIQGGFRGFALVPPGLHYISVEVAGKMIDGFWCYLKPSSAIVKIFDYEKEIFVDPDEESKEQYQMMALSGAMNRALIPVMQKDGEMAMVWQGLVSSIKEENFPVILNRETPIMPPLDLSSEELSDWYLTKHKSRFEHALYDTHEGNINSLLAEFQYAYASLIVKGKSDVAFERWSYLLQSFYNAGERSIESESDFFIQLASILIKQLKWAPEEWFESGNNIFYGINNMIEDMIDTGEKLLGESAKMLQAYLKQKMVI